jgi:hypothetical protein
MNRRAFITLLGGGSRRARSKEQSGRPSGCWGTLELPC